MPPATPAPLYLQNIESPIGWWIITADEKGLTALGFSPQKPDNQEHISSITSAGHTQLQEYFAKQRTQFDLPLSLAGHTDFHQQVWQQLRQIKYGKTTSYSGLSIQLGNPKAVRAVGTANGRNPIPIIIPCHRVIGKDRSLTGYAHGLAVKKWLLEHEGAIAQTPTLF